MPIAYIGPFHCCTCPVDDDYDPDEDDPLDSYLHNCGCPSVKLEYDSLTKYAEMCGTKDPDASDGTWYLNRIYTGQVNRYIQGPLIRTDTWSRSEGDCTMNTETEGNEDCQGFQSDNVFYNEKKLTYTLLPETLTGACSGTISASGTAVETRQKVQDSNGCSSSVVSRTTPTATVNIGTGCDFPCDSQVGFGGTYTGSGTIQWSWGGVGSGGNGFEGTIYGTYTESYICSSPPGGVFTYGVPFDIRVSSSAAYSYLDPLSQEGTQGYAYENPDTEEAALAAATEIEGSSDSSLWQERGGEKTFIKRTVKYTATAEGLVVGVDYKGCIRLKKRTVDAGEAPGEWEEVEADTIDTFTAVDTEQEVANEVDLPSVQGYEYEIVNAYIWKSSVPCNCPS